MVLMTSVLLSVYSDAAFVLLIVVLTIRDGVCGWVSSGGFRVARSGRS